MKLSQTILSKIYLACCLFVALGLPVIGFSQPPGPGDAGGGGNPDGVPFDQTLNVVFLITAIVFAGWFIKMNINKTSKVKELL